LAGGLAQVLGREAEGIELCRRAVAQNPIGPYERLQLGVSLALAGQPDEGEKEIRAALELAPDYAQGWYFLGLALLLKDKPESALEAMQREPAVAWREPGLALVYEALGQHERSAEALKAAIERQPPMLYQIAQVHAFRGDADEAFLWLHRAHAAHDGGIAWFLSTDPLLANIRGDPRYRALLRTLRLPELT
jgi:tetratricopeptide (TPR) repeat protein